MDNEIILPKPNTLKVCKNWTVEQIKRGATYCYLKDGDSQGRNFEDIPFGELVVLYSSGYLDKVFSGVCEHLLEHKVGTSNFFITIALNDFVYAYKHLTKELISIEIISANEDDEEVMVDYKIDVDKFQILSRVESAKNRNINNTQNG